MRYANGQLVFSATDLCRHVSCNHLARLRRSVALGELESPPPYDDPRAEVLRQRGLEHEQRLLEELATDGRTVHDGAVLRGAAPPSRRTRRGRSPEDFATQGLDRPWSNQLRTVVPSFNVGIQPISAAATIVQPLHLRNLAPDHTHLRDPRGRGSNSFNGYRQDTMAGTWNRGSVRATPRDDRVVLATRRRAARGSGRRVTCRPGC